MASTATLEPPAPSTERGFSRAQLRMKARGCPDVRAAEPPPPLVPTTMLVPEEIADAVEILGLLGRLREDGLVDPRRWRLDAVVYRLLLAQARSDESSTVRVGTHSLDQYRLLPAMRRDPATKRRTHHEHVRRALTDLEDAGLISKETVYDSAGQESGTDIRLLPAPQLSDVEVASATRTIKRWYAKYPAEWRRPLQVRGRRPKKAAPAVVADANVPPVPGLPPLEGANAPSQSSVAKAPERVGEIKGNAQGARDLEDGGNREVPRLRRMMEVDRDGAGRAARDGLAQPPAVSESSADDGCGLAPSPAPDSGARLGRGGVRAGSGSLGAAGGPLTPSDDAAGGSASPPPPGREDVPGQIDALGAAEAPLAPSGAVGGQLAYVPASWTEEARDAAAAAPPLGALLDDQALAELREVLDGAGLLRPDIKPDGLGRLSASQLRRLAADIAAWPALRHRHDGWGEMSAVEAIQWIASCAARSAKPLPPTSSVPRGRSGSGRRTRSRACGPRFRWR